MKKFIRKMNIGVLLAAVLLIATAAFVIITDVMFSTRKDKLETFVRQYIDDTCEANIGNMDKIQENFSDLVNRYFSDYVPPENEYDRSVCSYNFAESFDRTKKGINADEFVETTDCKADIRSVKIEKLGVDCARVTVTGAVKLTIKGSQAVAAVGAFPDTVICADKGEYIDPEFEVNMSFGYELFIAPDGDSWKIDYVRDANEMPSFSSKLVGGKSNPNRYIGGEAPDERGVAVYD